MRVDRAAGGDLKPMYSGSAPIPPAISAMIAGGRALIAGRPGVVRRLQQTRRDRDRRHRRRQHERDKGRAESGEWNFLAGLSAQAPKQQAAYFEFCVKIWRPKPVPTLVSRTGPDRTGGPTGKKPNQRL
jgi:hypothetical protein